jgi:hypothetical protein
MVGLMKTDYAIEDLSYEEMTLLLENKNGPAGSPSY